MAIVSEFLEWIEHIDTFATRFEKVQEIRAFYQGVLIGILIEEIEIEIKEKLKTGVDKDGKV